MALLALYDTHETALQEATRSLLEGHGHALVDGHDPEEAIIQLMLTTDWKAAYEQSPQFFEHDPRRRGIAGRNGLRRTLAART